MGKVTCGTCPDPHKRAEVSIKVECTACHSKAGGEFQSSTMQRSGVTCVDCHMPPAGKSAESFRKFVGDVKSHIVKISTSPEDRCSVTMANSLLESSLWILLVWGVMGHGISSGHGATLKKSTAVASRIRKTCMYLPIRNRNLRSRTETVLCKQSFPSL